MDKSMRDYDRKMFSGAFAVPQLFEAEEKYAFDENVFSVAEVLEKYASTPLPDDKTEDGVRDYLRTVIENEMTGIARYPLILKLSVTKSKKPDLVRVSGESNVVDAKGSVGIKIGPKVLNVPFLIRDGELNTFDVLEMDGVRVPYSRENLRKVVHGIEVAVAQGGQVGATNSQGLPSPFKGLSKKHTVITSPGFLGDALSIRNTVGRQRVTPLNTTADEKFFNELLEKTASMKPVSEEDVEKLAARATNVKKHHVKRQLDKIAADMSEGPIYKTADEFDYIASRAPREVDAASLPPFTVIYFIESSTAADGKSTELKLTKGITLSANDFSKTFKEVPKMKDKWIPTRKGPVNLVLSEDGRIRILDDRKFPCRKAEGNDNKIQIPITRIKKIAGPTVFLFLNLTNKVCSPLLHVKDVDIRSFSRADGSIDHTGSSRHKRTPNDVSRNYVRLHTTAVQGNDHLSEILTQGDSSLFGYNFHTFDVFGDDILKPVVCKDGRNEYTRFQTSPETKIVTCRGLIKDVLSEGEADLMKKSAASSFETLGLDKIAAKDDESFVKLFCKDRYNGVYDMEMRYSDGTKKFFKEMHRTWKYIDEKKVEALLRVINFSANDIKEFILEARNKPSATRRIPKSANFSLLQGGMSYQVGKPAIKKTIRNFVKPDKILKHVGNAAITALVSNMILQQMQKKQDKFKESKKVGEMARKMGLDNQKHAALSDVETLKILKEADEEAVALSGYFEKMAFEKKSKELLNCARAATASHHFLKAASETSLGENLYLDLPKVAHEILDHKESFEKMASELYAMEEACVDRSDYSVPSYLAPAMLGNLDITYKVAQSVVEAMKE